MRESGPAPKASELLGPGGLGFRVYRTPKICRIMASRAIVKGFGLSFYLRLEFR